MVESSYKIPIRFVEERRVGGRVYNVSPRKTPEEFTLWPFHVEAIQQYPLRGRKYSTPMLWLQRDATRETVCVRDGVRPDLRRWDS